jgi:hypothetical protein
MQIDVPYYILDLSIQDFGIHGVPWNQSAARAKE